MAVSGATIPIASGPNTDRPSFSIPSCGKVRRHALDPLAFDPRSVTYRLDNPDAVPKTSSCGLTDHGANNI